MDRVFRLAFLLFVARVLKGGQYLSAFLSKCCKGVKGKQWKTCVFSVCQIQHILGGALWTFFLSLGPQRSTTLRCPCSSTSVSRDGVGGANMREQCHVVERCGTQSLERTKTQMKTNRHVTCVFCCCFLFLFLLR